MCEGALRWWGFYAGGRASEVMRHPLRMTACWMWLLLSAQPSPVMKCGLVFLPHHSRFISSSFGGAHYGAAVPFKGAA